MMHRLRSILTLVGIVIGISAILFLVSFGFGLEKLVTKEITGGNAFKLVDVGTGNSLVVKLNDESINGNNGIKKIAGVKDAYTTINAGGKAISGSGSMDVAFYGTTAKYLELSGLKSRWGETLTDDATGNDNKAVVNTAYLKFLGNESAQKYLGREVSFDILIPKEIIGQSEGKSLEGQKFVISGIIKDDTSANVYINQSYFTSREVNEYSQAKVEVSSQDKIDFVRKQIENMGFKTQYVGDTVAQIEQIFSVFKIILGSFGLIALVVASLGMFNTLTISLLERIKEIALMKILGMRKRDIRNVFMSESIILGIIGGVVGIGFGCLLGVLANDVLNRFAVNAGNDPVSVFYYPYWFISAMFVFAVGIGAITGIYPAMRATKVNPLDVLRYE
jgi:putative ABC transport system permease protein